MNSSKKNGRFTVGLVGVALVVTYLMWTGISGSMMYYLTPAELMERIESDPSFREVGLKVSGSLVPGSYSRAEGRRLHFFQIADLDDPSVIISIEYDGTLPDIFSPEEGMEAVVEGRLREDGVFVATTLMTKCGSRYEASDEELAG